LKALTAMTAVTVYHLLDASIAGAQRTVRPLAWRYGVWPSMSESLPIEKESLRFKELERVLNEKAGQLFRNILRRPMEAYEENQAAKGLCGSVTGHPKAVVESPPESSEKCSKID